MADDGEGNILIDFDLLLESVRITQNSCCLLTERDS